MQLSRLTWHKGADTAGVLCGAARLSQQAERNLGQGGYLPSDGTFQIFDQANEVLLGTLPITVDETGGTTNTQDYLRIYLCGGAARLVKYVRLDTRYAILFDAPKDGPAYGIVAVQAQDDTVAHEYVIDTWTRAVSVASLPAIKAEPARGKNRDEPVPDTSGLECGEAVIDGMFTDGRVTDTALPPLEEDFLAVLRRYEEVTPEALPEREEEEEEDAMDLDEPLPASSAEEDVPAASSAEEAEEDAMDLDEPLPAPVEEDDMELVPDLVLEDEHHPPAPPGTLAPPPPRFRGDPLDMLRAQLKVTRGLGKRLKQWMALRVWRWCPLTAWRFAVVLSREAGQLLVPPSKPIDIPTAAMEAMGKYPDRSIRLHAAAHVFTNTMSPDTALKWLCSDQGFDVHSALFRRADDDPAILPYMDMVSVCESFVLRRALGRGHPDWSAFENAVPSLSALYDATRALTKKWPHAWKDWRSDEDDLGKVRAANARATHDVDHTIAKMRGTHTPHDYQRAVAIDLLAAELRATEDVTAPPADRFIVFPPGLGKTLTYLLYAVAATRHLPESCAAVLVPVTLERNQDWQSHRNYFKSRSKDWARIIGYSSNVKRDLASELYAPAIRRVAIDEAQDTVSQSKTAVAKLGIRKEDADRRHLSHVLITGTPVTTKLKDDLDRFFRDGLVRIDTGGDLRQLRRLMYYVPYGPLTRPLPAYTPVDVSVALGDDLRRIYVGLGVDTAGTSKMDKFGVTLGTQFLLTPLAVPILSYTALEATMDVPALRRDARWKPARDAIATITRAILDYEEATDEDDTAAFNTMVEKLKPMHPRFTALAETIRLRREPFSCPRPGGGAPIEKIHHRNIIVFSTRSAFTDEAFKKFAEKRDKKYKEVIFLRYLSEWLASKAGGDIEHKAFFGPLKGEPAKWTEAAIDASPAATAPVILFANYASSSVGLNLQAADTVILFDQGRLASTREQAIARAVRMGQIAGRVVVYEITMADTEEVALQAVIRGQRANSWLRFTSNATASSIAAAAPDAGTGQLTMTVTAYNQAQWKGLIDLPPS